MNSRWDVQIAHDGRQRSQQRKSASHHLNERMNTNMSVGCALPWAVKSPETVIFLANQKAGQQSEVIVNSFCFLFNNVQLVWMTPTLKKHPNAKKTVAEMHSNMEAEININFSKMLNLSLIHISEPTRPY